MSEKNGAGQAEEDVPAFSSAQDREPTDEEMLGIYAIYRNMSDGDTIEPFESLYQARCAEAESEHDNELAA